MNFEATIEFHLRRLQSYSTRIEQLWCDPFQLHQTISTLQNAGIPIEDFLQTQPNLTLATEMSPRNLERFRQSRPYRLLMRGALRASIRGGCGENDL